MASQSPNTESRYRRGSIAFACCSAYTRRRNETPRLVVIVTADGGLPSTSLLITAGKDVDADPGLRSGQALRRHDDSPPPEGHRRGRLVLS